jgi:hypothetical protein
MQNVGKPPMSCSPDIALIPAQGRDADAVHQDIQKARQATADARESHYARVSGDQVDQYGKDKLMAMLHEARRDRDMNPIGPDGPMPDPDAPCPIP